MTTPVEPQHDGDSVVCRCGWNGEGGHPCHRCGVRPGEERFYVPSLRFSVAGAQMKVSARQTWACVECWAAFREELAHASA